MTLGRTSSGSIKIKTDGGLRAVECACCVPCYPECGKTEPPPPGKWKIAGADYGYYNPCGTIYGKIGTSDFSAIWACADEYAGYEAKWILFGYEDYTSPNFTWGAVFGLVYTDDPSGTHQLYPDQYGVSITIEPDNDP